MSMELSDDGELIVKAGGTVIAKHNVGQLLRLREHYKGDIVHFTGKLKETDGLIAEAKKLGFKEPEEKKEEGPK